MGENAKLMLLPEGECELYLHGVNYAKETYPGLCRNSCSITPSTTSSDKFIMKKSVHVSTIIHANFLFVSWFVRMNSLLVMNALEKIRKFFLRGN